MNPADEIARSFELSNALNTAAARDFHDGGNRVSELLDEVIENELERIEPKRDDGSAGE